MARKIDWFKLDWCNSKMAPFSVPFRRKYFDGLGSGEFVDSDEWMNSALSVNLIDSAAKVRSECGAPDQRKTPERASKKQRRPEKKIRQKNPSDRKDRSSIRCFSWLSFILSFSFSLTTCPSSPISPRPSLLAPDSSPSALWRVFHRLSAHGTRFRGQRRANFAQRQDRPLRPLRRWCDPVSHPSGFDWLQLEPLLCLGFSAMLNPFKGFFQAKNYPPLSVAPLARHHLSKWFSTVSVSRCLQEILEDS